VQAYRNLKEAPVPEPSAKAQPAPATELTFRAEELLTAERALSLQAPPASPTSTLPSLARARPEGLDRVAASPTPSSSLATPEPATVSTAQPLAEAVAVGVAAAELEPEGAPEALGRAAPGLAEAEGVTEAEVPGQLSRRSMEPPESEKKREPVEACTAMPV
jgi:hypothetical protein